MHGGEQGAGLVSCFDLLVECHKQKCLVEDKKEMGNKREERGKKRGKKGGREKKKRAGARKGG